MTSATTTDLYASNGELRIMSEYVVEADARLIAAAPKLLEALKGVLIMIEARGLRKFDTDPEGIGWMKEVGIAARLEAARAAIARAEGE